ncbi:hypothetical protein QTL97_01985 [Sporosarcina thermotolerans]|uniref:Swarming motility protein SwrB n=1 Tax=Sporosarcina thermotolerans TaxID=633404 RepID=A0AAW9A401_9BACL|nr:hypothetical protein [Sporosarcina thermotolerans]MDW0115707.1 hypothetical protein [Sporosarcina thermotolerans]WHT47033.1 hypothetical protein QNH10_11945 [Sporosarcina thermotolerans]
MSSLFLLLLFVLQMVSFYVIALLYMKISKFNNLEKKQERLMAEMDDAIAAYLSELKEENERLINIIENREEKVLIKVQEEVKPTRKTKIVENENEFTIVQPNIPVNVALKSYQNAPTTPKTLNLTPEKNDHHRALSMFDEGKTVEEIAKTLGKGTTEVELLLKFR